MNKIDSFDECNRMLNKSRKQGGKNQKMLQIKYVCQKIRKYDGRMEGANAEDLGLVGKF